MQQTIKPLNEPLLPFEIMSLVKHFESLQLEAYTDMVGVRTIGYGFTTQVTSDLKLNEPLADLVLQAQLLKYHRYVCSEVLGLRAQWAYASLAFNVGITAVRNSRSWAYVTKGLWQEAIYEFWDFNKANGTPVDGLKRRRGAEILYWLTNRVVTDPKLQKSLMQSVAKNWVPSSVPSAAEKQFREHYGLRLE